MRIRDSPTFLVCEVAQLVSASGHNVPGLPISELEDLRASVSLRPLQSDFVDGPPSKLTFTGDSVVPELQVPEDTLFRGLYKTVQTVKQSHTQTVKQSHRGVAKVHQDTVREALPRAF